MLTDWGQEDTDEDVSEGVQQHDQDAGPEQPMTRRGFSRKTSGFLKLQLVIGKRGNSLEMGFVIPLPVSPGDGAAGGHGFRIQKPKSRSLLLTNSLGQDGSTD